MGIKVKVLPFRKQEWRVKQQYIIEKASLNKKSNNKRKQKKNYVLEIHLGRQKYGRALKPL
jgi:hypothetical protein